MKLSLIIPAYNEEKNIIDLLDVLYHFAGIYFHEVIIVDNASIDRTSELVRRFIDDHKLYNFRLIREERKGVTRARQRGFQEATGNILVFIDADCLPTINWIEPIITEFTLNSNLACLSGPYKYYDLSKYNPFQYLFKYACLIGYYLSGCVVLGGNFAIKRSVLEQMGGFDTSIEFFGEDTNTGRRAKQFGKVKFSSRVEISTSARRFIGDGWSKTMWNYAKSWASETFLHKSISSINYKDHR